MPMEATAPGKAILFGEHSVVYRGPAVVLSIDRRARVVAEERDDDKVYIDSLNLGFSGYFEGDVYHPEHGEMWRGRRLAALNVAARRTMEHLGVESGVNLIIRSEIPIAVGLGSSAAICVATVAAVGALLGGGLSKEEICELAYEGERVMHGSPSGVDNNISTYGGILRYERGVGFERFTVERAPPFIIGNTRRRRSTRRMVEGVRALRDRMPRAVDSVIDALGRLSQDGLDALLEGDLPRLGGLMNISHGLLAALGVSTPELDLMVHASRRAGALGAKLTGAGGGGCVIALSEPSRLRSV
ncbi:MAG: mevalonate kinase, partial [Candidatus Bathyarchaeia archaeon]